MKAEPELFCLLFPESSCLERYIPSAPHHFSHVHRYSHPPQRHHSTLHSCQLLLCDHLSCLNCQPPLRQAAMYYICPNTTMSAAKSTTLNATIVPFTALDYYSATTSPPFTATPLCATTTSPGRYYICPNTTTSSTPPLPSPSSPSNPLHKHLVQIDRFLPLARPTPLPVSPPLLSPSVPRSIFWTQGKKSSGTVPTQTVILWPSSVD